MNKRIKLFWDWMSEKLTGDGNVLRENLEVVYGRNGADEAVREYRRKKLNLYAAVFVTIALCVICLIVFQKDSGHVESLIREESGRGGVNVSLKAEAEYGGEEIRENLYVNIPKRQFTEDEAESILKNYAKKLPDMILEKSENGERIAESDLRLPIEDTEYGISIVWDSSDPVIISKEGFVDVIALAEGEEKITLYAELSLDGVNAETEFDVLVRDDPGMYEGAVKGRLRELSESLSHNTADEIVELPEELEKGIYVSWKKGGSSAWFSVLMLGVFIIAALYISRHNRAKKDMKKYREAVADEFPVFIDKLVMLLNSGLTVYGAMMRISEDYKRSEDFNKSKLGNEIVNIGKKVKDTNASVAEEWRNFASRMESGDIFRFCTILEDNMSKGSELCVKLEHESDNLRDMKKKNIQKYIRELDSKMMIPMMIMLCSLILVTVVPAMAGF